VSLKLLNLVDISHDYHMTYSLYIFYSPGLSTAFEWTRLLGVVEPRPANHSCAKGEPLIDSEPINQHSTIPTCDDLSP
jgi:hypothetical protein